MRDVVDPELGINVVDLGLVYGVQVDEASNAVIDMTLTTAASSCAPSASTSDPRLVGGHPRAATPPVRREPTWLRTARKPHRLSSVLG
jgi:uncharacterized ferredoxin-like protein